MRNSKHLRLLTIIVAVLVLLSALSGCQKGKKFESPDAMIYEMTGTYSGLDEHNGERIIIDGNNVIKFNIEDIFPEIKDDNFFWENFPNENWEAFDIDALLSKSYIETPAEPISTNLKESTISGLWVDKSGVLFSQEGYPLNKISSDSVYPTSEMLEKFEEYRTYLQEYEKSSIIAEAQSNFLEKQESLNSALSSATSSNSIPQKSMASAETIANCAFDSLKDFLKYPRTAKLDGYSTNPQYDSYGRVTTLITCTYQNGVGNYITEDVYVILQSCSYFGEYTYQSGGMHYSTDKDYYKILLVINDWDSDPNKDDTKETPYNEAIQLIKNGDYLLAAEKLEILGEYKSSESLKDACVSYSIAEKYKEAVNLFSEGEYTKAIEELTSLLKDRSSDYLRIERVIVLCNVAVSNTSSNGDNSGSESTFGSDGTSEDGGISGGSHAPDSGSENTQEITDATVRTCPQCGKTEPEAMFTDDWIPGKICFGCSYLNTHGGENARKFCSQCGADCTFRGLEEDGRCEDCYNGRNGSSSTESTVQTSPACEHNYSPANCTDPKTCTICGKIDGNAAGHNYNPATCTAPMTCSTCGKTTGDVAGHLWNDATCTEPATCSTCYKVSGDPVGHYILISKCQFCDYTDFSSIAKSYIDVSAYDATTGEAYIVENVSIDFSGVLSFSFNGKSHSLTLDQTNGDRWEVYFNCYNNGSLEPDAYFKVTTTSSGNYVIHLEWNYLDGCNLYFAAKG